MALRSPREASSRLPLDVRDTTLPSYLGFVGQPATAKENSISDSAEKPYAAFCHGLVSPCMQPHTVHGPEDGYGQHGGIIGPRQPR